MKKEIEKMIEAAVEDYRGYITAVEGELLEDVPDYRKSHWSRQVEDMIERFEGDFEIKTGRKYIKVINRGEAWAFVVNTDDDDMFDKGDILMAAGWAAPARNRARGNVLEGDLTWIKWTGPEYLN